MCEGESCYYPSENEFFYQVIRLERHERKKKKIFMWKWLANFQPF